MSLTYYVCFGMTLVIESMLQVLLFDLSQVSWGAL